MARDYYEILGVPRGATDAEIKKAYRKLAREFHPDVNRHDPEAEAKFKEANQAYEVLSDPGKRSQYDQFGHVGRGMGGEGFGGFGGEDFGFENIFDMFFGDVGGRAGRRRANEDGSDYLIGAEITFEEAAFGGEKEVELVRAATCGECAGSGAAKGTTPAVCKTCGGRGMVNITQRTILGNFTQTAKCPDCGGTGQVITTPCKVCRGEGRVSLKDKIGVKIPAGVMDGIRLRVPGKGEAGRRGGATGDLYVEIAVKPHPLFTREADDVHLKLPLAFTQAALGCEIEIPTLEGKEMIKIPHGTQSGARMTLKSKGVHHLKRRGRGDQVVEIVVETPTNLTEKQRRLLEELAELRGEDGHLQSETLFEKIKGAFGG